MSDLLKYLSSKLQEDMRAIEEDIAMGKASDFGAYKYGCGIYRGLLMANEHVRELAERMENDDD